jgi:hypothetical protein
MSNQQLVDGSEMVRNNVRCSRNLYLVAIPQGDYQYAISAPSLNAASFQFSFPLKHRILKLDQEDGSIRPYIGRVIM